MADRRSEVLEAAAEEIAQRGFSQSSFSSIGERLGMSKGHLQYYIRSKPALAQEIVDRAYPGGRSAPDVGDLPAGAAGLLELVASLAHDYVTSPFVRASLRIVEEEKALRPSSSQSLHEDWISLIEALTRQAVAGGELDPNLDAADFAIRYLGVFIGTRVVCLMLGEIDRMPERVIASAEQLIRANAS